MKLFKSSNIELIKECQGYFRCLLPSSNDKKDGRNLLVNTKIRSIHFVNIVMLCECTLCVVNVFLYCFLFLCLYFLFVRYHIGE